MQSLLVVIVQKTCKTAVPQIVLSFLIAPSQNKHRMQPPPLGHPFVQVAPPSGQEMVLLHMLLMQQLYIILQKAYTKYWVLCTNMYCVVIWLLGHMIHCMQHPQTTVMLHAISTDYCKAVRSCFWSLMIIVQNHQKHWHMRFTCNAVSLFC